MDKGEKKNGNNAEEALKKCLQEKKGRYYQFCELVDPDELINQLRMLKSINVDGVVVDCWWGIVEAHAPNQYNWNGYKKLFQIVQHLNLMLHVICCRLSFEILVYLFELIIKFCCCFCFEFLIFAQIGDYVFS
ncbi:hypothetical protein ABFX02_02G164800 [Erythranthe guttata]